jgi:hypothetical protein
VREGITVTSAVLARGAAEVRIHLVAGAATGTPVRVTGWPAGTGGVRAELLPAVGLSDALTGTAGAGPTLFAALARLTGEPDPAPLADLVSVRADGPGALEVRWSEGAAVRVRLDEDGVDVAVEE